ncbi:MAG: tetratricopeptide repeat protein, partial [Legionella sp.]
NEAEAIRLLDQAIALGHAGAMNSRGYMHQHGQGGPKNEAEAIRLYDQAIALGHTAAMTNRAYMHKHGQGGPENEAEAIRLYDEAIALGHAGAMTNRGCMHQHGQGGPKNEAEAIRLLDQAIASNEHDDKLSPFHQALYKLKAKAELLKNKGYGDAYEHAMVIYFTLVRAHNALRQDGDRNVFNETCTDIIKKKRPILDSHRGWSEFLINLAIAIPTLGVGLLIKGVINVAQNKSFFFVHKTETGEIVNEIESTLDLSPHSHGTI